LLFAVHMQRRSAGHHDLEQGAGRKKIGDLFCGGSQVFEVVEHEQRSGGANVGCYNLDQIPPRLNTQAELLDDGRED